MNYHNEKPLVSVLMTAFNREKFIAEAIESVLASTYTNFELIVVDDSSKDKTVEIAKNYEAIDQRVKVYINEKNLGDYPNRNKAAEYAKGKYIKYVDADDLIYPHGLEVMVRAMETFPDAGFALCRPQSDTLIYPAVINPKEIYKEHFFIHDIFGRSPLGAIIKRECFIAVGGFQTERYHYLADTDMWYRLAMFYPMVKMVPGLGHWRSHGTQQSVYGDSNIQSLNIRIDLILEHLYNKNCPLNDVEKKQALNVIKHAHARKIWSLIKQKKIKNALKVYNSSILSFCDFIKGIFK